jgi:hypothetical protein
VYVDGQPIRVRGDREPTEHDINVIREVRDAMASEVQKRAANPNHWPWDANGSEVVE